MHAHKAFHYCICCGDIVTPSNAINSLNDGFNHALSLHAIKSQTNR